MLIDEVFFRDSHLILRDVDGSEVTITLQDAADLRNWLNRRYTEIVERIRTQEKQKNNTSEREARE